jgi:transcriptional regulator with XRE-family HTH domain
MQHSRRPPGSPIGKRGELATALRDLVGYARGDEKHVADRLGVTRGTVSRWVTGTVIPSPKNFDALSSLADGRTVSRLRRLYDAATVQRENQSMPDGGLTRGVSAAATATAVLYSPQSDVYDVAAELMERAVASGDEPRTLALASLHGFGGRRVDDRDPKAGSRARPSRAVLRFDRALSRCIAARKPHTWQVRQLFNIDSEFTLERVLSRLRQREARASQYEVRAYAVRDAPRVLSPLVVARRWVLLAPEDEVSYRVSSALAVDDTDVAAWAEEYFDRLWDEARYRLRTQGGIDARAVEQIQNRLRRLPKRRTE